jgi:hypothetical protein
LVVNWFDVHGCTLDAGSALAVPAARAVTPAATPATATAATARVMILRVVMSDTSSL